MKFFMNQATITSSLTITDRTKLYSIVIIIHSLWSIRDGPLRELGGRLSKVPPWEF